MNMIKKIWRTLLAQYRDRGLFIMMVMNMSHLRGVIRGMFYKLLYYRNIQSSLFALESNSTIEVFSRHARIHIGKFVFIRKNASIRIDFHGELSLGDKVFINDNCNINCVNKITIGENTKIASPSSFATISGGLMLPSSVLNRLSRMSWACSNSLLVRKLVYPLMSIIIR